jgi:hypothetical protein
MQYKELTDSAKECAYKNFQEYNSGEGFDFQVEDILENYRDMLETKGLYDLVFDYSGFHSQGDGACFTCSINLKDFLEAHILIREAHPELYIAVIPFDGEGAECVYFDVQMIKIGGRTSSYSHEMTVWLGNWNLDVHYAHDLIDGQDYEKLFTDAKKDIEEQCRDYMRQLYRTLEEAHTNSTSIDVFIEQAEFQDFNENGDLA